MTHDCPGPACHPYPTFDADPARWGLLPEPEMTEAELEAEAEAEWADEWDSADSHAYMDRVEAGLEPEAEL
jgi:hypothetical protein